MKLAATILSLTCCCAVAHADAQLSFPLDGYYRIGRFTAIAIDAPPAQEISIEGDGLLPLRIAAGGKRVSGVFPLLVLSPPGDQIHLEVNGQVTQTPVTFRPLGDNDRLIGTIGAPDPPLAQQLFPGKNVIPLQLDSTSPLRGSPAAWDVLDAVISDGSAPLPEQFFRHLLPAGITFATRAAAAPDTRWPWRRDGGAWVLRYDAIGPKTIFSESAYAPVLNWSPGALPLTRVESILFALLFSILALATTLLQRWWRLAALTLLVVAAASAFALFADRQVALRQATGAIRISSPALTQIDLWEYQTRIRAGHASLSCTGLTRPILNSPQQAREQELELRFLSDEVVSLFIWRAAPNRKMAFLTRSLEPSTSPVILRETPTSPLRTLTNELYQPPASAVIFQERTNQRSTTDYQQRWPTLIIQCDE